MVLEGSLNICWCHSGEYANRFQAGQGKRNAYSEVEVTFVMTRQVINNTARNRFELDTTAGPAVADYRLDAEVMTIYHTEVPVRLRGQGIGCRLVEGALVEARSLNMKVVPSCWFVREFIERNPSFADVLA